MINSHNGFITFYMWFIYAEYCMAIFKKSRIKEHFLNDNAGIT